MPDVQNSKIERPLSPHLQIYKFPFTAVTSILHRMTGVALAIGTLMVVWWLLAAATSEAAYDTAMAFAVSPVGKIMLFGWSLALYFHLCNGLRHLIWDTGRLFDKCAAKTASYIVVLAAIVMTLGTWALAYM